MASERMLQPCRPPRWNGVSGKRSHLEQTACFADKQINSLDLFWIDMLDVSPKPHHVSLCVLLRAFLDSDALEVGDIQFQKHEAFCYTGGLT